ncbi:MAG: lysostaphin resistance A-like protein [Deltaproteobacteria bacterium]
MADLKSIGNSARDVLFAGSLALWVLVFWRKSRGVPSLSQKAQGPVAWPAVPVFATFVMAMVLPQFIIGMAGAEERLSLAAVQWRALAMAVQGLIVVGLLLLAGPVRRSDFGWDPANWRGDALVGAGGFLASLIPVFLVNGFIDKLGWRPEGVKHLFFEILEADSGGAVLAWIAVSVVVLAPLAEELTYRVLLQGWCQSQIPPAAAILFSAMVFSIVHRIPDCFPLFPLAVILGYVYHRTRSYVAIVVLHALFNATNLTLAVLSNS